MRDDHTRKLTVLPGQSEASSAPDEKVPVPDDGPGELEPELEKLERLETDARYYVGLALEEMRESVASHLVFSEGLSDNGDGFVYRSLAGCASAVGKLSEAVHQLAELHGLMSAKLLAARDAYPEKTYLGGRFTEPLSFSRRSEREALRQRKPRLN